MKKNLLSVVVVAALFAVGAGLFFGNSAEQAKKNYLNKLQTATVFQQPRALGDFQLTDNVGQPYTQQSLLGHWTLFFFGFTNCGHICPTTMAELKQADALLKQQGVTPPQVMLVSIDPKRDSQARLDAYVKGYSPDFRGARAPEPEIAQLTKRLGILYLQLKSKDNPKDYDIDHSGSLLLFNPKGQLTAIFSMPHKAKQIAHDFALIQKYNGVS